MCLMNFNWLFSYLGLATLTLKIQVESICKHMALTSMYSNFVQTPLQSPNL